ncbi:hypothetical protein Ahy_B02g058725 isoform A [Arachis hypogaea]|uniref:Uncharacterized protein n=1 Tax=Arachis hypogaea TaxID=3818 RepID=A0A445AFA4_ARAHY|nr:hypothetical protein Ahy_B02g058725 isoform A [Arachis hypogaea]
MLQIIMNPTRRDWRPQPNNLIVPETTATTLLHQSSILIGFGARPHLNRNKNRVYASLVNFEAFQVAESEQDDAKTKKVDTEQEKSELRLSLLNFSIDFTRMNLNYTILV